MGNIKELDAKGGIFDIGPTLISHEIMEKVYELSPCEEFSTQTLRAVEKLTHCTIIVDGVNGKLTLKGDTAEDVDKAFEKLVVISKSYVSVQSRCTPHLANRNSESQRTSGLTSFDFYNPENEVNFRFQFHTPERVIDRNILLHLPDFMTEYAEVHMVKWNSSSSSWVRVPNRPSIPHPLENVPDHPWFEHVYPALGREKGEKVQIEASARKNHDYLAPAQITKLTAWTENIPLRPDDPFNAPPIKDATALATFSSATIHPRDYTKPKRTVKGSVEPAPTVMENETSLIPEPPPITEPYMPEDIGMSIEEEIDAIMLAEPSIPHTVPIYSIRGVLIDHPEPTDIRPVNEIQPQRVPQWTDAQAIIQQRDDEIEQEQEVLRKLNILSAALQPVPETVQRESEASSRRFRHSTNLQVSKAGSIKTEATSVIDRITKAMSGILEIAQMSYGRITLEMAIGHVYVGKNEPGTDRVVQQSDWSSAFKTRNGADRVPTYFSSV